MTFEPFIPPADVALAWAMFNECRFENQRWLRRLSHDTRVGSRPEFKIILELIVGLIGMIGLIGSWIWILYFAYNFGWQPALSLMAVSIGANILRSLLTIDSVSVWILGTIGVLPIGYLLVLSLEHTPPQIPTYAHLELFTPSWAVFIGWTIYTECITELWRCISYLHKGLRNSPSSGFLALMFGFILTLAIICSVYSWLWLGTYAYLVSWEEVVGLSGASSVLLFLRIKLQRDSWIVWSLATLLVFPTSYFLFTTLQ